MKLIPNQLKQAEFARNILYAKPEANVTFEEVQKPEFWAHVAKPVKAGDRIEVVAADGSWFAELYVRSSAAQSLNVAVMRYCDFSKKSEVEEPAKTEPEYEVKFAGRAKWRVMRKSDNAVMIEGLDTKEQAEEWIKAK